MKILITGSAGFVGKNLFVRLKRKHDVFGISRRKSQTTTHQLDLTLPNIHDILSEINPDVLIHAAALAHVDYCETHPEEAFINNVVVSQRLSQWASQNNKKLIYLSTDYVYPGETNDYNEQSPVRPLNIYGQTKLEGEKFVSTVPNHTILRTTVVFGHDPEGLNFLMQMLNLKTERNIPEDQISNPTAITVLGDYMERIIENDLKGLFIATGPESVNRFEFACRIADIFALDKSLLKPTVTSELKSVAQRQLNNATNPDLIGRELHYNCCSLSDSLKAAHIEYTKYINLDRGKP